MPENTKDFQVPANKFKTGRMLYRVSIEQKKKEVNFYGIQNRHRDCTGVCDAANH